MSRRGELRVHHVWKRFRADRRKAKLFDELSRLRARLRGEQPERWRWALQDVDFTVDPGESIALVGANGSGKSTLLKILTQVMYPYAGNVDVNGRVGAMIEVRSGIHPELSGRENVFLYGRLLGLSRSQIVQRFEEIIEFAELGTAIDRQVKHYSSGMQMRLGFAVAAYLEPDILLVDEVLAVGDARFQQRCLDRMRKVLASGTTLVFVSHDLAAVEAMCQRSVWLEQGVVRDIGPTRKVLGGYRQAVERESQLEIVHDGAVRLVALEATAPDGGEPRSHEDLVVRMVLDADEERDVSIFLGVSEGTAASVFVLHEEMRLVPGATEVRCTARHLPLPGGRYSLWLGVFDGRETLHDWRPAAHVDVTGPDLSLPPQAVVRLAPVRVDSEWEHAPVGGRELADLVGGRGRGRAAGGRGAPTPTAP